MLYYNKSENIRLGFLKYDKLQKYFQKLNIGGKNENSFTISVEK